MLFDLAVDALASILDNARHEGFVKGLLIENLNNGVNVPQYAGATIFLLQDDEESARNLKFIFSSFEQMYPFLIRVIIFLFGEAVNGAHVYQEIFTCELGSIPLKMLGLHVSDIRTRNKLWKMVTEKIEKICAC